MEDPRPTPSPADLAKKKSQEPQKPKKPFVPKPHLTQRIEGLDELRNSMRPKRGKRGGGQRR